MPLILTGAAVGLSSIGVVFDPSCPYCGCRICGAVYQSDLDRHAPVVGFDIGKLRRERWREVHTRRYHSERQINAFAKSKLTFTPEAANKLAPLGVIPLDQYEDEETNQALWEAPRAPTDDVEGT